MEFLNKNATIVFTKLIDAMKGEHLKIENEPYMPLTVELIGQGIQTPWGNADQYSLCHYYEQNGDLMQDPEMCFLVTDERKGVKADFEKIKITPYIFQQASLGVYEKSISRVDYMVTTFHMTLHRNHLEFANLWLRNIQQQGFLKQANQL